jgi:cell division septation protein DedD
MHERRLSERKSLGQLGYIGLANNGAIFLDVSEGGLGFRAVAPVTPSGSLPFWFSANSNRIEGVGELIWIDEAKKTGGLRFTQLSASTHEQIRSLLNELTPRLSDHKDTAARASLTNRTGLDAEPGSGASPHSEISWPETSGYTLWSGKKSQFEAQNRRPLKSIVVSVLAVIIAILLLRDAGVGRIWLARTFGRSGAHAVASATTPAADVSAGQSKTEGAPTQAAPESSSTAMPRTSKANAVIPPPSKASAADTTLRKSPLSGGGLFLQVGAFRQEANAGKLAESLRQENFPAFIITSKDGALYLVHVGPYLDEKSARIALSELRRAGFEPFILH